MMKKSDMIAKVAEKAQLTKQQAQAAMEAYTETIVEALKEDGKVQVSGFGTFEIRERGERIGRNPANGEQMTIAAKKTPCFRAGKSLKDQF